MVDASTLALENVIFQRDCVVS